MDGCRILSVLKTAVLPVAVSVFKTDRFAVYRYRFPFLPFSILTVLPFGRFDRFAVLSFSGSVSTVSDLTPFRIRFESVLAPFCRFRLESVLVFVLTLF